MFNFVFMILAAIDIGTNAMRLSIVQHECKDFVDTFHKVAYYRVPLRLGEDVFDIGKLGKNKAAQLTEAIKAFLLLTKVHGAQHIRAVATSALREAKNAKKITAQIAEQTGLEIEIISGDEEARLIFSAFEFTGLLQKSNYILIDVGGGSTEISVFENGSKVAARSFELGTIRIQKGKVSDEIWGQFTAWLTDNTSSRAPYLVLGTGGNINRALKIIGTNANQEITLEDLLSLQNELLSLSLSERLSKFKLKPDRAEVLGPALQIYTSALLVLKQQIIRVPQIGLSDGMIYELFLQNNNT